MDYKQQFGQLDPKLKEVYERVMGTSVASAPKAPAPPSPQPVTPPMPVQMQQHSPPIPQPESLPPAGGPQIQTPIAPQPQTQAQTISVKPHGHISPVVWILGGLTFVVVYVLAWVKIFNLKLPFTP